MLLGKRPRPPMRRTTSMTGLSPDFDAMITDGHVEEPRPSDEDRPAAVYLPESVHVVAAAGTLSPRTGRSGGRSSGDFRAAVETAAFLKACGLCNRRLGPGRDIYIYRGEVAFCSLECRQQLINQEERRERRTLPSVMAESPSSSAAGGSEASANGGAETVAAA